MFKGIALSSRFASFRRVFALAGLAGVLLTSVCALSACGDSSGGKVVATVGEDQITQAMLAHWMEASVAGDYRELNAQTAPEGLVSEPANYSRCVAGARQIPTTSKKQLSSAQLALKCRQLYTAVKEQTLSFLISELWASQQAKEHGQSVSQTELNSAFQKLRYRRYANPARFKRFLAEQRRSIADERYLLKRNLLTEKILAVLKRKAPKPQAFVALVKSENAKLIAKTECKPGYRSIQCRQYSTGAGSSPSAAVLVEQLKAGGR